MTKTTVFDSMQHQSYRSKLLTFVCILLLLFLAACDQPQQASASAAPKPQSKDSAKVANTATPAPVEYKTIEWTDLMPKSDLDALLNPPEYLNDIQDGALEDQISSNLKSKPIIKDDPYQQALVSTRIVPEMNNQPIRVPGFIVPLTFAEDISITQFFLVPFFGACIHLPPPPPNQIIFVNYPQGLALEDMYSPYWISGIVKTQLVENNTATSAYSMQLDDYELYTEELIN